MDMSDTAPAIRIVHLCGGLRVFEEDQHIDIGVECRPQMLRLQRPEYKQLYSSLKGNGFTIIGSEFYTRQDQLTGETPVDWQVWDMQDGFLLMNSKNEWSFVRHQAAKQGDQAIQDVAGRIGSYLELINLRIRDLSNAYNSTLLGRIMPDNDAEPGLFGHMFMVEIDASLHAFVSDAASFRDLLAEACWNLVLKKKGDGVRKMSTFLKKAKDTTNPIAQEIIREGKEGGWIKNLTDIRNDIVHVAPLSHQQEFSMCDLRLHQHDSGVNLLKVHYPFANEDGSLRKLESSIVDFQSEVTIGKSLDKYQEFNKTSFDALEYAWQTTSFLVALAETIRKGAGLKASIPEIKPVGPVTVKYS